MLDFFISGVPSRRGVAYLLLPVLAAACTEIVPRDIKPVGIMIITEREYSPNVTILTPHDAEPTFLASEGIIAAATVSWPDRVWNGGKHDVTWRVSHDGLTIKETHGVETLEGKPATILSHIGGGSFPAGDYQFALEVDHRPMNAITVHLRPAPARLVPANVAIGPDCAVNPAGDAIQQRSSKPDAPWMLDGHPVVRINPITKIHLGFPFALADHPINGCAVAAVQIGADGTPAQVSILAEQPKNSGFADDVAREAWRAHFPPGHAGEIDLISMHFRGPH